MLQEKFATFLDDSLLKRAKEIVHHRIAVLAPLRHLDAVEKFTDQRVDGLSEQEHFNTYDTFWLSFPQWWSAQLQ